jgi:hypothetical protein
MLYAIHNMFTLASTLSTTHASTEHTLWKELNARIAIGFHAILVAVSLNGNFSQ